MNFFSSDPFLKSLQTSFFPGRDSSVEPCEVVGNTYRMLVVDDREVISDVPFLDFVEPVVAEGAPARRASWIARAVLEEIPAGGWKPTEDLPELDPAPFIKWSGFSSWEGFTDWVARCGWSSDIPRKRRRLERELGRLSFTFHDPRPEVLRQCLAWKSRQYVASGVEDYFRDPRWVAFFDALNRSGALIVSSLRAGDQVVAVHAGMRFGGRFSYWMPAHDPALFRHSPGKVLLYELLQRSLGDGDAEFDFLIGGEPYKFQYATHVRVVGPVGTPPLVSRLAKRFRREVRTALQRFPEVDRRVRAWRKALRARGQREDHLA